jgi:hypothetical protein
LLATSTALSADTGHNDLLQLFDDWRAFEFPSLLNGAPDYTRQNFDDREVDYLALRKRLEAF